MQRLYCGFVFSGYSIPAEPLHATAVLRFSYWEMLFIDLNEYFCAMDQVKPIVEIDPSAGFCSGVKRAIEAAEHLLDETGGVFCLGEIVHNEAEMNRLRQKGLIALDPDGAEEVKDGGRMLIRAHGAPPGTFGELEKKHVLVTNATCPVVLRLQQKVKKASEEMVKVGGLVLIYGKPSHAEVVGLLGNAIGNARVIDNLDQLGSIDFTKPLRVFSQTTSDLNRYRQICDSIQSLAHNSGSDQPDIAIHQTICGQVSRRGPALEKFALSHDVIIFVSGSESSNGKYLFGISKTANSRSFRVSGPGQVKPDWLKKAKSVGISGATSTPIWLMGKVAAEIEAMNIS
jgi:4-hydroxy-3-methylbut-2-enyl diphosphate reductase